MRYEVTWITYEINWENEEYEQTFISEQFDNLEEAMEVYKEKTKQIDVEHVRIVAILSEHNN